MEETPEFKEHVERLFTPLKPGLAFARTAEFMMNDFEPEQDLDDISKEMLELARKEAVKCIDIMEEDMLEQIYDDARRYIEEGCEMDPGWNASNVEQMEMNLVGFCDSNISIWDDNQFPRYKANAAHGLDDAGLKYVESFVGSALAAIPYHIEDGDEEVYYDSDVTTAGDQVTGVN